MVESQKVAMNPNLVSVHKRCREKAEGGERKREKEREREGGRG